MADVERKGEAPAFKYCESCGIRLMKPSDCGGGDPHNARCKDCCKPDGSYKDKEEVKQHIKKLFFSPDAITVMGERVESDEEAEKLAEEYMKKMPAWQS
ncbi:hypothetical protein GOV09_04435 [Candidatus Woesearchaeota archaeon]|nr:hypothetical protein [Candidatus Woesearchaeota archaeon]